MTKDIEDKWLKDIQMLAGTEPPLLFRVLCIMGEANTAQGSFVREIKGEILKCMDSCKNFLGEIRVSAGNYTMHDLQHSINVIHLMGQLVREPQQMSAIEIASLIYAALLHDIGMVKCPDEENISLDMIRIRHGERSATFIEKEIIKDYTEQSLDFGRYHMILKHYLPIICLWENIFMGAEILNVTIPDDESMVRNLTNKDSEGKLHIMCKRRPEFSGDLVWN